MAAHAISYDCIHPLLYGAAFVVSGLSIDRTNQRLVASWRHRSTEAIIEAFRRSPTPRYTMKLLGRRIALLDAFVHQQDIRRPLGHMRKIPSERLAVVDRRTVQDLAPAGELARGVPAGALLGEGTFAARAEVGDPALVRRQECPVLGT